MMDFALAGAMRDHVEKRSTQEDKKPMRSKSWCVTSYDLDYMPWMLPNVTFVCGQPEVGEHLQPHLQLYIEIDKPTQGRGVNKALGQPADATNEHGLIYFNTPRIGTQEQAIAYCTSTWYCRKCSMGDHTESSASYDWSYSIDLAEHTTTTLASVESVCHLGCTNVETLYSGLWSLDSSLWTLDSRFWTLDPRPWTLDPGLRTWDSGL